MASTADPGRSLRVTLAKATGEELALPPARSLVFDGRRLVLDGRQIAEHTKGGWLLPDGQVYLRLDCNQPVEVTYSTSGRSHAFSKLSPLQSVSSVDGFLYGNHDILAYYDQQHDDWYSLELAQHWPRIAVAPA